MRALVLLAARTTTQPAELLGVTPVFEDERNAGRPVDFCDVVVRDESKVRAFSDLQGGSWEYNDVSSLNGYYGMLNKLTSTPAKFPLHCSQFHDLIR